MLGPRRQQAAQDTRRAHTAARHGHTRIIANSSAAAYTVAHTQRDAHARNHCSSCSGSLETRMHTLPHNRQHQVTRANQPRPPHAHVRRHRKGPSRPRACSTAGQRARTRTRTRAEPLEATGCSAVRDIERDQLPTASDDSAASHNMKMGRTPGPHTSTRALHDTPARIQRGPCSQTTQAGSCDAMPHRKAQR